MKQRVLLCLTTLLLSLVSSINYCGALTIERLYGEDPTSFGLSVVHGPLGSAGAVIERVDGFNLLVDRHTVPLGSFWRAEGHGVTLEMFPRGGLAGGTGQQIVLHANARHVGSFQNIHAHDFIDVRNLRDGANTFTSSRFVAQHSDIFEGMSPVRSESDRSLTISRVPTDQFSYTWNATKEGNSITNFSLIFVGNHVGSTPIDRLSPNRLDFVSGGSLLANTSFFELEQLSSAAPEPSTISMFGMGVLGLLWMVRNSFRRGHAR